MMIIPNRSGEHEIVILHDETKRRIGYVSEGTLYAIGRDGYADSLGSIQDNREIVPLINKWREANGQRPA